jgi:hypothetical protein
MAAFSSNIFLPHGSDCLLISDETEPDEGCPAVYDLLTGVRARIPDNSNASPA